MNEDLCACPFCGTKPVYHAEYTDQWDDSYPAYVVCPLCNASPQLENAEGDVNIRLWQSAASRVGPLPFAQIAPMLCPHCGAECAVHRESHEEQSIDEFRTERTVHSQRHICAVHGDITDALAEAYMNGFTRFFGY